MLRWNSRANSTARFTDWIIHWKSTSWNRVCRFLRLILASSNRQLTNETPMRCDVCTTSHSVSALYLDSWVMSWHMQPTIFTSEMLGHFDTNHSSLHGWWNWRHKHRSSHSSQQPTTASCHQLLSLHSCRDNSLYPCYRRPPETNLLHCKPNSATLVVGTPGLLQGRQTMYILFTLSTSPVMQWIINQQYT
jgi:hypothetical protein